jgi:hypothetical protein
MQGVSRSKKGEHLFDVCNMDPASNGWHLFANDLIVSGGAKAEENWRFEIPAAAS